MNGSQRGTTVGVGRWLVRIWFSSVGLATLLVMGAIVQDMFWGEGIEHVGLLFVLAFGAILVVGLAVVLLPLLVVAVVLQR